MTCLEQVIATYNFHKKYKWSRQILTDLMNGKTVAVLQEEQNQSVSDDEEVKKKDSVDKEAERPLQELKEEKVEVKTAKKRVRMKGFPCFVSIYYIHMLIYSLEY